MYKGKVDLHLHLDGSLSEEVVAKLLQREGIPMSAEEIRHNLQVQDGCTSLVEYLQKFALPSQVMQNEYALELTSYDLVKRLAEQGLVYAEIRFAPQLHTLRGLKQREVLDSVLHGIRQAQRDFPSIRANVLICAMIGGLDNHESFDLAKDYFGNGVVGVDLAGAEGSVPLSTYAPLFEDIAKFGMPYTIHAGECGSWENVRDSVNLGAKRVGHGCGAVKNADCMELLRRNQTVVEHCVVSNLQTKAVASLDAHPIKTFYDFGIRTTINTDNMACSNTTLAKEHEVISSAFNFSDEDYRQMDRNAINGAFISDAEKAELLLKL